MIPKILFQTFETANLTPGMQSARESWLSLNPQWKTIFYAAEERRGFIAQKFGNDVLAAYDRLDSGAFKADLWRYCVLHEFGGAYADIDSICLVPLEDFLKPEDRFVASRAGRVSWGISNGFIASEAQHPFLAKAIERGTREILAGEVDGYLSIGPGALGISMNITLRRPPKAPFEAGDHGEYRLCTKNGTGIYIGDTKIILTEYCGYKEDLSRMGIQHWRDADNKTSLAQRLGRKIRLYWFSG